MAFRGLCKSCSKSFSPIIALAAKSEWLSAVQKGNSRIKILEQSSLLSLKEDKILSNRIKLESYNKDKYSISHQNNHFIDLFTNNVHKRLYMPTLTINKFKVYQDIDKLPKSIEDNRNIIQIIDPVSPEQLQKKEAVRMILIRRRKMRKHKLRKLRKRMKFVFEKRRQKRELRKEQAFRTELLSQIEASEKFDAKEYVENILHTLRYHPKPESKKEILEKYRIKMKKHRYQTNFIIPNFDE